MYPLKKLSEICEICNGSTPSRTNNEYWENGDISWFTIDDIRSQGRRISSTRQKITQTAYNETSVKLLPPGSILLCCTASVGEYAITEIPLTTNQQFNGLIIKDRNQILPAYLFYFCSTLKDTLMNLSGKTTIDFIPISRLKDIHIPLPPLSVQLDIVARLDSAMAEIETLRRETESALASTRELWESTLESVFASGGKDWETRTLGDKDLLQIIDGDRGKNYPTKSDFSDEGSCLFLNTKNVRPDGFEFSETMFISQEKDDLLRNGKLQRNDVLLTTRGTIGNIAIYNSNVEYENIRINSGMLIFRPNNSLISSEYFFELLRSGIIRKQIREKVSGAAQPQLPIKTLINFTFPLPLISEQSRIVAHLDAVRAETERLEVLYRIRLASLDELRRSVLAEAFL